MADLDLSIVVFCVMVDLILLLMSVSITKSSHLFPFFRVYSGSLA